MKIDLTEQEIAEVRDILREHVPEYTVWAFGSRVQGRAKKYSDLDLAIMSREPLPLSKIADLKGAFDESDLVFKVDIVDWSTTSHSFRQIIEAEHAVLKTEKSAVGSLSGIKGMNRIDKTDEA